MIRVIRTGGEPVEPKFKIGENVWHQRPPFRGQFLRVVTGMTYYEGLGYFCYWLDGLGHDVPEDELEPDES